MFSGLTVIFWKDSFSTPPSYNYNNNWVANETCFLALYLTIYVQSSYFLYNDMHWEPVGVQEMFLI